MTAGLIAGLVLFGAFEALEARDRRTPVEVRFGRLASAVLCGLAALLLSVFST